MYKVHNMHALFFFLHTHCSISYLVVDEADKFMQGNMEEQLRKIFAVVTSTLRPRQTLLFSATLPENLERLARSAVLDPVSVHMPIYRCVQMCTIHVLVCIYTCMQT